jgi:hypothetical protein
VTNVADDRLYAWLESELNIAAITNIAGSDGICRDDWAESDKPDYPRVEYNPFRYNVQDGGDTYAGQFGITVYAERTIAYGSGDNRESEGPIWTLEASVVSALDGNQPTGVAGFTFSPIGISARRRPTRTPDDVVGRRINFNIVAYPGIVTPMSGDDADLTGLSSNLVVTSFNVSADASANKDFTTDSQDLPTFDLNRPSAVVQIRVRVAGDGTVLFPAIDSRQTLTFKVTDGVTWNNEVLIRRVQWVPNIDEQSAPQVAIITGLIDYGTAGVNSGTPVFDGTVP